jgi:hypothetical protein
MSGNIRGQGHKFVPRFQICDSFQENLNVNIRNVPFHDLRNRHYTFSSYFGSVFTAGYIRSSERTKCTYFMLDCYV